MYFAGVDIGGTKSAVLIGGLSGDSLKIISKEQMPTSGAPGEMLEKLAISLKRQIVSLPEGEISAIGISCGGPLNSAKGIIQSPPNLPGWDDIHICDFFRGIFKVPVFLQNDANACAVAEWKYGAGRGTKNMIFLTFGTGFGAGLILNGALYSGANDMAGEIGHVRIAEDGPIGYGKKGSLEGFCSGGGIAQLGQAAVREAVSSGSCPQLLKKCGSVDRITAKDIGDLADQGDEMCRDIYRLSGRMLGYGLSLLIDLLNPERIVIGSIFTRSRHLLWGACEEVIRKEALSLSCGICRVVPSGLGDSVGDYASLALASALN